MKPMTETELTRAIAELQSAIETVGGMSFERRPAPLADIFKSLPPLLSRLGEVEDGETRERIRRVLVDRICDLQMLGSVPRTPVLGPSPSREEVKNRMYQIIRTPKVVSFATVDESGQPVVRYVVAAGAENLNVAFATQKNSRKCAHVRCNPSVSLAFKDHSNEGDIEYVHIEGTAKVFDDPESRKAYWNPMLYLYHWGPEDPSYVVMAVMPRRAELTNLVDIKRGVPPLVWEP